MINRKIIADSSEPSTFNAFINNDTKTPASTRYNIEQIKEMKKYHQVPSSNQKNMAFAKINPMYNTPATFQIAFGPFARKNGINIIVNNKKKPT
ncbi:MAG TPA: hypothetical protein VE467_16580 [Chryseolinea sp.]|jgi:hypothetical protein|nr:hypothetical protein [Chryseolinea sp.]